MTRHIVLVTLGTYGDILTRIALGEALMAEGASVTIVSYAAFEELVRRSGAGFRPVPGDPRKVIENARPEGYAGAAEGNSAAYAAALQKHIEERRARALMVIDAAHEACADADLIVSGITSIFVHSIAEARGIPARAAFNVPLTPTDQFASVIAPVDRYARPCFTKASHRRSNRHMGRSYTPLINFWRTQRAGLDPLPPSGPLVWLEKTGAEILYGCSPTIVPQDPAWGPHIEVTGPWRPRIMASDPPAPELARFIEAGPPPVVIGFSSARIAPDHQARLTRAVQDCITGSPQRFVILSGWMNLTLPGQEACRTLVVDEAPHDWLFPRAACVVHAGGAGSCHAQLGARVPGVILPLWGDQYFWARRMAAAGRAIGAGRVQDLTGDGLRDAIGRALALETVDWAPEPTNGGERAARRLLAAVPA